MSKNNLLTSQSPTKKHSSLALSPNKKPFNPLVSSPLNNLPEKAKFNLRRNFHQLREIYEIAELN
jgi:hypothetical protein